MVVIVTLVLFFVGVYVARETALRRLFNEGMEDLNREDAVGRYLGCLALANIELRSRLAPAVPRLIELLDDDSTTNWRDTYGNVTSGGEVSDLAREALTHCRDPRAIPVLAEHLNHKQSHLEIVAHALGSIGTDDAVQSLTEVLESSSVSELTIAAATGLGIAGNPESINALNQVLQGSGDEEVRLAITQAIELIKFKLGRR